METETSPTPQELQEEKKRQEERQKKREEQAKYDALSAEKKQVCWLLLTMALNSYNFIIY